MRFPHLDDVYYKALREISSAIGEVVWSGKEEDYLMKSSTPRVCVLIENTKNIPSSVILPIPGSTGEVEIFLEYEGIPSQCQNCLELGHAEDKCPNPKQYKIQNKAKGNQKLATNQPKQGHKPEKGKNLAKSGENKIPGTTTSVVQEPHLNHPTNTKGVAID